MARPRGRRRARVAGALLAALPFVLAAPAAGAAEHGVAVGQGGDRFTPSTLEITAGDTVVWTNHSGWHNVHGDGFQNTVSNERWSFRHTFTSAGTFAYVCDVHPGMKGTIVVAAGAAPSPTPSPTPSPRASPSEEPAPTTAPSEAPDPASPTPQDPDGEDDSGGGPAPSPSPDPSGPQDPDVSSPSPVDPDDGPDDEEVTPSPTPSPVVAAPAGTDGDRDPDVLLGLVALAVVAAAGTAALVRRRRAAADTG